MPLVEISADTLARIPELARLKAVLENISQEGRFALAYSGGLDSRFLAFCAKGLGFDPELFHIIGPQIAPDETAEALSRAESLGLEATCVPASSLSLPELAAAGRNRCYICKRHLFEELKTIAKATGAAVVCDGTNASDLDVYRPGLKALRELGIRSPLAEAGISKSRIREIGKEIGFPYSGQAARPCLLTRFPYGVAPSHDELLLIADAELFVAEDDFGKLLRFRIRMPVPNDFRLHVAKASLERLGMNTSASPELEALKERLLTRFAGRIANIRVEVLETLSGYYDLQMDDNDGHDPHTAAQTTNA